MNRRYRVIWCAHKNTFIAAPEFARARGKSRGRSACVGTLIAGVLLATGETFAAGPAPATLPIGGQVSAGSAQIASAGANLTVHQTSARAAINWQSFSIGAGASVRFVQPDASAIALNRVVGTEQSVIQGALTANGQVFLLNPNGVIFGRGARVDTAGLVASTLNLSDADFMAGRMAFSANGSKASVINLGTITAADNGYVALLGNQVRNEGVITAKLGTVALAAGDKVSLNFNGSSLLGVTVDRGTLDALVENRQAVFADGGTVVMTAKALDTVLANLVNNTGEVRAQTIENRGGRIFLTAANGDVSVEGKLDAAAPNAGDGGEVRVLGDRVTVGPQASIDVSGKRSGGTALIGGDLQGKNPEVQNARDTTVAAGASIRADGGEQGGRVIVWADDTTRYAGHIYARGAGFVEVSGKGKLSFGGSVDTGGGKLLLDPTDITVQSTAGDQDSTFGVGQIATLLGSNDVTLAATNNITWNSGANLDYNGTGTRTLTLRADNNISFGGTISDSVAGSDSLNVVLNADRDASGAGSITMSSGSSIATNGGAITLGGGTTPSTTAAFGTATNANGVKLDGATLNSGSGAISIRGTGASNSANANDGVLITGGSKVTAAAGISITGQGGGTGSSASNKGVEITGSGTQLTGTGAGAITLTGTGGTGGSGTTNFGVYLDSAAKVDAQGAGGIAITGTGGGATGSTYNDGVALHRNSVVTSATGAISITGTGGTNNGTSDGAPGITFGGDPGNTVSVTSTGSAPISVTATPGASSKGLVSFNATATIGGSSASGDITLTTDSVTLGTAVQFQSSGQLLIQPRNTGTTIGLGNSASGTLNFNATALGWLANGFSSITFGRSDGTGAIDVRTAAFTDPVTIRTPVGSGNITVNGALSTGSSTSAGAITLQAGNDITLAASSSITTQGQAVTLNSDRDATGFGAMSLATGAAITSNGGNITLRGGNSALGTLPDPTVTANQNAFLFSPGLQFTGGRGDSGTTYGVSVSGATINAGGGNIEARGIGGTGKPGIYIGGGATVTTTGSGTIALYGAGGASATDGDGVQIAGDSTSVTTANGAITIYGLGRGTSAAQGVAIVGSTGTAPKIESANGAITIRGASQGTTSSDQGVLISTSGIVRTTGTGDIDITGRGSGSGSDSHGIFLLDNALVQTTGGGNLTLTGYGSTSGSSNNNEGVKLMTGSLAEIQSGTNRTLTITGTGGTGTNYNIGVNVLNSTVRMASGVTGQMNVTGTGGNGSGTGNWGVLAENNGIYESLGAAAININGTGGTGTDNHGIKVTGGTSNRIGRSTMTGDITLTADTMDLLGVAGGTIAVQSSGNLLVQPKTASTTIGLGNSASGTLNLDATELTRFTNGFSSITIGRSDGTGAVDVRTAAFTDPVTIRTPAGSGNITVNGALSTGTGTSAGAITLQAADSITLAASSSITTQNSDITLDADRDASGAGNIRLLSGASLASNGGNIQLAGGSAVDGSGRLTGRASGSSTSAIGAAGVYAENASIQSSGGSIRLLGQGSAASGIATDQGAGIFLTNGTSIDGGSGTVLIDGLARAPDGSGNAGVLLREANASGSGTSRVQVTSSNTTDSAITINGQTTGSGTSANSSGIDIRAGTTISATGTTGGGIAITGTGGAGDSSGNHGVNFETSSGDNITISANAGPIAITGTRATSNTGASGIRGSSGTTVGQSSATTTVTLNAVSGGVSFGNVGVKANALAVTGAGTFDLSNVNNSIASFASNTTGGALTFVDARGVAIDTVGATPGASISGGDFALRTTSGDIVLNQAVNASGSANITLASAGNFTNNVGSSALGVGSGRWLVWATNPANDTRGELVYGFKQYNATYGSTTVLGSGNGFLYTLAPVLTAGLTGTVSKTYDATTAATLTAANYTRSGAVDGDTVTLNNPTSGTYDNKHAGSGKTITASGIALASAVNGTATVYGYQLASATASAAVGNIAQRAITVTAQADTKVYDRTVTSSIVPSITSGALQGSDTAGFTQTFDTKNVGTGKTLTASGAVNDGNGGADYSVTFVNNTAGAITPRALSVGGSFTASSRTYDGTTAATIALNSLTLPGAVGGDAVSLSPVVAFADKNAAAGKTVSLVTGSQLTGGDAANYTLTLTGAPTATADITKATVSGVTGITTANKVYDGTTAASLNTSGASFTGMIGGDSLSVASANGTFADKNAGAGKTVSISGITLGGADAGNYTLASATANTTADITKATISGVTGITAANKVYDGTTAASLNTSGANFTGMISGDSLSVASASGAFADKNAATGKTVAISDITLGGTDAANYTLASTTASTTADITKATVTGVTGITAANKVYDGTTAATLNTSGASFTGMISGDSLSVASASGAFADKNAATGKTVAISGITLGGTDAANYTLASATANTTADITKATVTGVTGITAANKVYDGTTAASLNTSGASFTGMIGGDSLSVASASGAFADKNAATGKTVAISGITLGGADAGNYTLASATASTTADISKAAIASVTGITASSRTFDGTTAASLDTSTARYTGIIAGDSLNVASASGAFADKSAGTAKTVSITGIALGGADAGNYTLANTTASATADITPRALTYTLGLANPGQTFTATGLDLYTPATIGGLLQAAFGNDVAGLPPGALTYTLFKDGQQVGAINGAGVYQIRAAFAAPDPYYVIDQLASRAATLSVAQPPSIETIVARAVVPTTQGTIAGISVRSQSGAAPVNIGSQPSSAGLSSGAPKVIAAPAAGESTQLVTLDQARSMMPSGSGGPGEGAGIVAEVRVPASRNSGVDIVNGGVRLPAGVSQMLFVVKDGE